MKKEQQEQFELCDHFANGRWECADGVAYRSLASVPTLNETIQRMKSEIMSDIRSGKVPKDVKSFSELHDYVDANCYGGFCEDDLLASMIDHFGGSDEVRPSVRVSESNERLGVPDSRPDGAAGNKGMPDGMMQYLNDAQDAIHRWIVEGGIAAQLDQSGVTDRSNFKVKVSRSKIR